MKPRCPSIRRRRWGMGWWCSEPERFSAIPTSASSEGHSYLALGDSVSFGFNPLLNPTNAANFTGYPEIVAQRLNIEDVNPACSGEATGSFISLTGLDNVCRPYRSAFPL